MLKTLSIFTGNFFPTYFFPIKADKERPSIVRINPETVWSCFRITVTNACNDENIDAVYISTPIGNHEEWVLKSAKAGKHVLCEKSSTTSFDSAKKMVNVVKENNVRLMEGFMYRFHPSHQKVKKCINENEIILKKLGRINNSLSSDLDKPAATMVVSGDLFKIYFDKDVDLKLIKENLTNKQNRIQEEMNKISQRLENKSFVDRAPKEIVEQEKNNYNNLKNDIEKISVTIKGI